MSTTNPKITSLIEYVSTNVTNQQCLRITAMIKSHLIDVLRDGIHSPYITQEIAHKIAEESAHNLMNKIIIHRDITSLKPEEINILGSFVHKVQSTKSELHDLLDTVVVAPSAHINMSGMTQEELLEKFQSVQLFNEIWGVDSDTSKLDVVIAALKEVMDDGSGVSQHDLTKVSVAVEQMVLPDKEKLDVSKETLSVTERLPYSRDTSNDTIDTPIDVMKSKEAISAYFTDRPETTQAFRGPVQLGYGKFRYKTFIGHGHGLAKLQWHGGRADNIFINKKGEYKWASYRFLNSDLTYFLDHKELLTEDEYIQLQQIKDTNGSSIYKFFDKLFGRLDLQLRIIGEFVDAEQPNKNESSVRKAVKTSSIHNDVVSGDTTQVDEAPLQKTRSIASTRTFLERHQTSAILMAKGLNNPDRSWGSYEYLLKLSSYPAKNLMSAYFNAPDVYVASDLFHIAKQYVGSSLFEYVGFAPDSTKMAVNVSTLMTTGDVSKNSWYGLIEKRKSNQLARKDIKGFVNPLEMIKKAADVLIDMATVLHDYKDEIISTGVSSTVFDEFYEQKLYQGILSELSELEIVITKILDERRASHAPKKENMKNIAVQEVIETMGDAQGGSGDATITPLQSKSSTLDSDYFIMSNKVTKFFKNSTVFDFKRFETRVKEFFFKEDGALNEKAFRNGAVKFPHRLKTQGQLMRAMSTPYGVFKVTIERRKDRDSGQPFTIVDITRD